MYDISPPDMHVEVENTEEDEWSQSGCGERMDRLEDDEKPKKILPCVKYWLIIIKLIIIAKGCDICFFSTQLLISARSSRERERRATQLLIYASKLSLSRPVIK